MRIQGRRWNTLLFYKKINSLIPWFLVSSLLLRIFVLWTYQLLWTSSVKGALWAIWDLMCFIDRKIILSVFCGATVYIVITSQDTRTKVTFKKPSKAWWFHSLPIPQTYLHPYPPTLSYCAPLEGMSLFLLKADFSLNALGSSLIHCWGICSCISLLSSASFSFVTGLNLDITHFKNKQPSSHAKASSSHHLMHLIHLTANVLRVIHTGFTSPFSFNTFSWASLLIQSIKLDLPSTTSTGPGLVALISCLVTFLHCLSPLLNHSFLGLCYATCFETFLLIILCWLPLLRGRVQF